MEETTLGSVGYIYIYICMKDKPLRETSIQSKPLRKLVPFGLTLIERPSSTTVVEPKVNGVLH